MRVDGDGDSLSKYSFNAARTMSDFDTLIGENPDEAEANVSLEAVSTGTYAPMNTTVSLLELILTHVLP